MGFVNNPARGTDSELMRDGIPRVDEMFVAFKDRTVASDLRYHPSGMSIFPPHSALGSLVLQSL